MARLITINGEQFVRGTAECRTRTAGKYCRRRFKYLLPIKIAIKYIGVGLGCEEHTGWAALTEEQFDNIIRLEMPNANPR